MPEWTSKEERQYEDIKESSKKRGIPVKRAKQIAARTVNKQRRKRGETPNKRTEGTGNPNRGLQDRTRDEIYNIAKQKNIHGRSKMKKSELIQALRKK